MKTKTKRNTTRILVVTVLLVVALCATVTTVQAARELKVTDHNLHALKYWGTWTPHGCGELLKWEGYPATLDARYQYPRRVGNIRATTVADNKGWYRGQCVSLGKALSKNNAAGYRRGHKVMSSNMIQPGTVIATFRPDGTYDSWGGTGHVAIFRGYVYGGSGRTGIQVWDQNYVSPYVVGRHNLMSYGTGVNDADNYYTVMV